MGKIAFIFHVHNMTNRKEKNNKEEKKKSSMKRKESYSLASLQVDHSLLLLDLLTF